MNILEEAIDLTSNDRNIQYGDASIEFKKVAIMWSVILGIEVKPHQVPLCMVALKLVREAHKPKRDNRVDGAAYFHLEDKVVDN